MATIENYFEQAQLSLAAYAKTLQIGWSGLLNSAYVRALVDAGMSQKQAEEFAKTYTVVAQSPETDPSGFSATLFRHQDGSLHVAIRGTEGLTAVTDWSTNFGDIGVDGIAAFQGVALFNWLQRLVTPADQQAPQVQFNQPIRTFESINTVPGLGQLSPAAVVTVAGHSLGGHLAAMMSRIAPNLTWEVFTFNAPGIADTRGLTSEGFFSGLANAGVSPGTGTIGAVWDESAIHGLNVNGDSAHKLPGFRSLDSQRYLFSESANQGLIDAHDIKAIVPSLAIYKLFATLDPSLNNPAKALDVVTGILEAAAVHTFKSLESVLDAVRTLFITNADTATPGTNAAATTTGFMTESDNFFANYYDLINRLKQPPYGNGTAQTLNFDIDKVSTDAAALTNAAKTDLATRYALYKLNPFVIHGTGLYDAINSGRALDLYDTTTQQGLTDEYLKDRAAFLAYKLRSGTDNSITVSGDAFTRGSPKRFEDRGGNGNYQLFIGDSPTISGLLVKPGSESISF